MDGRKVPASSKPNSISPPYNIPHYGKVVSPLQTTQSALTGIRQVLCHGFDLLLGLERGQLQSERAAVLVGEEVVQLRRVGIHPAHEVLDAIQLDCGDTLACGREIKK